MFFHRSNYKSWVAKSGLTVILIALLTSCLFNGRRSGEEPLAKAFNRYLYLSDLQGLIPSGTTSEDSLLLVKSYIDLWLKKQAVLNRAEFNLPEDKKNLKNLMEEYRTSLLIYEYEKLVVAQKLDTVITANQTSNYYLLNSSDFTLQNPIIKGVFFKISKSSPKLSEFRDFVRSTSELSYKRLVSLGAEYAESVESYEENWTSLTLVMQKIPGNLEDPVRFLERFRYLESEDGSYIYFLKVLDYILPGKVAPIEFVEHEIRDILLNKRKMEFLRELEESIYNDAVIQNQVEVYENK